MFNRQERCGAKQLAEEGRRRRRPSAWLATVAARVRPVAAPGAHDRGKNNRAQRDASMNFPDQSNPSRLAAFVAAFAWPRPVATAQDRRPAAFRTSPLRIVVPFTQRRGAPRHPGPT